MKKIFKKFSFSILFFSVIFSIALFYMNKIVFLGDVSEENYIEKFFLGDFSILLIFIPIVYFIIYWIEKKYLKISKYIVRKKSYNNKKGFCLVAFIFLLIVYSIYYLSFYPGGVYIDTWTSLEMLTGKTQFSSQQPVFYTLLLNIVKICLPNVYLGFAIFSAIQVIIMVSAIVYFIYWLLNKNVNQFVALFCVYFFAFFNLYPLYSVSIWKDTPFSIALFMYMLTVIDLIFEFKDKKIKISTIIKYNIFSLLTIFLRNNGLYLVLLTSLILVVSYIKDIIKKNNIIHIKSFLISICIVVIASVLIEKSFVLFGIEESPKVEMLAIPIQQISRVVSTNGNITEEQKELIEKVLPIEKIKKEYRALIADKIKWDGDFNEEYLESHMFEYLKLWIELFMQNPQEYINAYLLQTSGFWTFNVKGSEAYTSAVTWETLNNEVLNKDLIGEYTNFSVQQDLLSIPHYSGGFFFWIMMLSMFITYRNCNKKALIGYIPALILWLTVMIATPMGQALRYVYILVLILPFNFIYPAIMKKEKEKIKE